MYSFPSCFPIIRSSTFSLREHIRYYKLVLACLISLYHFLVVKRSPSLWPECTPFSFTILKHFSSGARTLVARLSYSFHSLVQPTQIRTHAIQLQSSDTTRKLSFSLRRFSVQTHENTFLKHSNLCLTITFKQTRKK